MKQKRLLTALAMLFFIASGTLAQEVTGLYNPFVPANLDDDTKITQNTVVESSYHRYWINGDANYTAASTFVWYVENGEFGIYDPVDDNWIATTPTGTISNGHYLELAGVTVAGVANSSEIWVKWNDGKVGQFGYIAVYERSSNMCILDQQIDGFRHELLAAPEVWFAEGTREECSDQAYTVEVYFDNVHESAYPYTMYYQRPDSDGNSVSDTLVVALGDLDTDNKYYLDFVLVRDLNVAVDENYTITITELRDKYGSKGNIAPEGVPTQYGAITLTILHLPQTQQMQME